MHAEGYTLGVRNAEKHDAGLADLAADFARDFRAPVNIHMYCTPPSQHGFGWHYDAEDVFILQTAGEKEYSLRKNTVNPWPTVETIPPDMRFEREIMPVMKCRLQAGDWLYIPAGYWHVGQSSAAAISLAVGLMTPTALDLFDFLRTGLLDSLLWRQRLPVAGDAATQSEDALLQRYGEIVADLAADLQKRLSSPALVRDFLRRRAPDPGKAER